MWKYSLPFIIKKKLEKEANSFTCLQIYDNSKCLISLGAYFHVALCCFVSVEHALKQRLRAELPQSLSSLTPFLF